MNNRKQCNVQNSSNPIFSIIVPVYNVELYLVECLQSLVNQTMPAIEIILIDDGSTDSSGKICDYYARSFANIRVLHQKNMGQSKARNEGIKIAKGSYLMFVDSDDYIVENACEELFRYIQMYDVDILVGDMLEDRKLNKRKALVTKKVTTGHEFLQRCLANNTYDIVPWLKIIKRKFFMEKNLYFYEGCYYEDQEFSLRLLLQESRLIKVECPFYFYRENLSSTTHIHELKKGLDCITIIQKMIQEIDKEKYTEKIIECANNVVAMSIYHLSNVYLNMNIEDQKKVYILIDKTIRDYARKTKMLTYRMKIQNRLFIYCPHILVAVMKIKNRY